jgi:amino acid adenylation domain-containing protein
MWMPVAMLGVMKAGGASVALDTSQPVERLLRIIQQVGPQVILTSSLNHELASKLTKSTPVIVDRESLTSHHFKTTVGKDDSIHPASVPTKPSDLLYVVFTSGSTGTPKGAMITHSNFSSAARYQQPFLHLHQHSRIYDFASYSFDVSWANFLNAITSGGCLCIPSEHDRQNRIEDSMRELRANYVEATPSVAELLSLKSLPKLDVLVLGGELLVQERVSCINDPDNVINTYGPAECTITSTGVKVMPGGPDIKSIGRGLGTTTWVVDPNNHDRLVPLGDVGELLIEGPLVGQGYLNDPAKTEAAFIDSPPWLLRGGTNAPGRRGRLYKTGDLVRYNEDGTLSILGRKDCQVKIRGQRVELGEVEHHIQRLLPSAEVKQVTAEVVSPEGISTEALIAFIVFAGSTNLSEDEVQVKMAVMTATLNETLAQQLPSYMIPNAYVPLNAIPITPNGKTDRRRLREEGRRLMASRFVRDSSTSPQLSDIQTRLAGLWVQAVKNPHLVVGLLDNFFTIGGDSISAMRLASLARKEGVMLTVSEVFLRPTLQQMASKLETLSMSHGGSSGTQFLQDQSSNTMSELSFTILPEYLDRLGPVEDVFPCTPLQSALFSLSEQNPHLYLGQHVFKLHQSTNILRFKDAVEQVMRASPILRTVFVPSEDCLNTLLQAVVRHDQVYWIQYSGLPNQFLLKNIQKPFRCGDLMTRVALVTDRDSLNPSTYFVLTAHHAVYDGWSLSQQMKSIDRVYRGLEIPPSVPFKDFVQGIPFPHGEDAYWKRQLDAFNGSHFPSLPSAEYRPITQASIRMSLDINRQKPSSFTIGTLLRAAWAVTAATYSNSDDVVFGSTLSGRNVEFEAIELVNGPTFTTVPIRLYPSRNKSVFDLLSEVQKESAQMIPFEHTGLAKIARMSPCAKIACDFKTLFVIQPLDEGEPFASFEEVDGQINYSYGLVLECNLTSDGVYLHALYDPEVLDELQTKRVCLKFKDIFQQMGQESPQQKLGELRGAERDVVEMLSWIQVIPESHGFIHHAIGDYALNLSSSEAICAWDGRMTYAELDSCSSTLAEYLIHVGTGPEQMIPMLMEKSKWAVVSILAIFKAGGIYVPLDPNYPQARLRAITAQIDAQTCLTSLKQEAISSEIFSTRVVVEEFFQSAVLSNMGSSWKKFTITPSSGAYTIFTSGSTGEPKGVVVEHKALMHSAREHGKAFKMSCTSRTLQFCSFTFDVSLAEILTTLLYGGCVCIPSDSERLDNLSQVIARFGVNCALLTPSVASTMTPKDVPTLKSLVLCGEPMNDSHVSMWSKAVHLINGYGPTECAIFSVINTSGMIESDPTVIGYATGCNAWVVDSTDHNILLPIGAIGELLLEGPLLARGYLNDLGKTEASFVEISSWTSMPGLNLGTRFYKTGDLVRFNNDGTLAYIGRKDLQIKLHGQRMEIADVESHLRQVFGYRQDIIEVHADIVKPYGSTDPHLAAFVRLQQGIDIHDQCLLGTENDAIATLFNDAKGRLLARIPRHMVPTLFVPIKSLPVTSAGKLDRKMLRAIASRLTTPELTRFTTTEKTRASPENELERKMQNIWSIALGMDKSLIGRGDNFFELGGDSMSALRVAVKAQVEGISILTSDVFTNPVLAPLCGMISSRKEHSGAIQNNDKRVLVGRLARDEDINTISRQLGIKADAIEDIYEATSFQSFATVTTLLKSRGNINYYFFIFDGPLDKVCLHQACRKIFEHHNLLRTVFTASRRRALQVVLKSPEFVFEYFDNINDPEGFATGMIHDDSKVPVLLGDLITRFALIQNGDERSVLFMRLSHAQYDGVSLERMKVNLENEYNGLRLLSGPKFVDFFHYANTSAAETFWTEYLKGSKMTQLINHLGPAYRNIFDYMLERRIPARTLRHRGITDASLVKAAWAYTLALLTRSLDVVFGVLTSGRNAAIPGIDDIDGPTVNQTPCRVQLQKGGTVMDLLQNAQEQQAMTMPYESTPFCHIIEKYTNWPKWSRFSSIVHHASILDIKSMKLGDTGCRISSFTNECDTSDVWVRSNFIDDQFHIILAASRVTIPHDLLQAILGILCDKIAEFASDPDAALEDPSIWGVADSRLPLFPKNTLPSRPQLSQDVDFVNSPFRALVEKAWDEILCIHETEFREQDVKITPETAFFDVWGNMLAAQQFAAFYSAHTTKTVLLEDIIDYPSMRGQVFLLA